MGDDLYREICRNPGDDTLRLVYADWLDEHGDHDRAEFVRAWYELEGMPAYRGINVSLDWSDPTKFSPECRRAAHLRRREGELLRLHPEWARCPCEACEGGGIIDQGCHCPTCSGTGDLFLARTECYPGRTTLVPIYYAVTFARGFPDSVTCTLGEAFAPAGTPTPWACEVVRRTPVTRFVLTDADPPGRDSGDRRYPFHWRDTMFTHGSGYIIADLCDKNYRTLRRALDVFALAAGRLVRRHVYGEVTA